jgi:hypothetical protein
MHKILPYYQKFSHVLLKSFFLFTIIDHETECLNCFCFGSFAMHGDPTLAFPSSIHGFSFIFNTT